MTIQQQTDRNREILKSLPTFANFAYVWCPEILDYTLQIVYESVDRGYETFDPRNA